MIEENEEIEEKLVKKDKPSSTKKTTKKPVKVKLVEKKKIPEKTYTISAYCNIVGASTGARFVANMKFKSEGKLTVSQWEEMFLKQGIIW